MCQNVSNIIICLPFFPLFLYYSQMEIHPSNIIRFLEEKILAFSNWKQLLFRKEDKNTISICTQGKLFIAGIILYNSPMEPKRRGACYLFYVFYFLTLFFSCLSCLLLSKRCNLRKGKQVLIK